MRSGAALAAAGRLELIPGRLGLIPGRFELIPGQLGLIPGQFGLTKAFPETPGAEAPELGLTPLIQSSVGLQVVVLWLVL